MRFDIVMTHDAEDLIHPESLRLINYFARTYDMVQMPVLALPTPAREWSHGLYCDDFAEFQSKDIPVRQFWADSSPPTASAPAIRARRWNAWPRPRNGSLRARAA